MNLHEIDKKLLNTTLDNQRIVAIGNFDGVHLAHQEILKNCISISRDLGREILVVTFKPHPSCILRPDLGLKLITEYSYKKKLLESIGNVSVLTIPFTTEFSLMSAKDFISEILVKTLNASHIVSGYNFHFGHNKQGNSRMLHNISYDMRFKYLCINKIYRQYHEVSSSNIRKFLQCGAVNIVSDLLGRRYSVKGKVVKGRGTGTKLSFRTANINLDEGIIYPRYGVYQVNINVEGILYNGVANIGLRPSFNLDQSPILEVHIFDFDRSIYGADVVVEFLDFMRPERKFSSLSLLKDQILFDIRTAKGLFRL
ncbi:bifunctional riboflavin kinase/FAD synthetase [Candidatus Lariskella endosymbiont of Epinotia ramella]|uniref:bifunctional riboflavin kinase/FAD synthetase n=1 Tax=Candidatus Lariskella endosymbiont of Epinotia ramella TaxID=3066224 RepID=UPI0030CC986A